MLWSTKYIQLRSPGHLIRETQDKQLTLHRCHFKIHFVERNSLYLNSIVTDICSPGTTDIESVLVKAFWYCWLTLIEGFVNSTLSSDLFQIRIMVHYNVIFITRVSEVIMFSPCVFVCLWVCVYVCHDVCPDDLTMKDWCHTNNISQVHCWGCLVVQVMLHTLMTSLMTSQDQK